MSQVSVALAVVQQAARPPFPAATPPLFRALVERCWHQDPKQRPSFKALLGPRPGAPHLPGPRAPAAPAAAATPALSWLEEACTPPPGYAAAAAASTATSATSAAAPTPLLRGGQAAPLPPQPTPAPAPSVPGAPLLPPPPAGGRARDPPAQHHPGAHPVARAPLPGGLQPLSFRKPPVQIQSDSI